MGSSAKQLGWVLAALFALRLGASCHHATRETRLPLDREPTLTVMTYNVNYARSGEAATLAAILDAPADLVFLQETNRAWQGRAQSLLAAQYPHQRWLDGPRAGGQAVLARRPFAVREVLPAPTGWFPAVRVVAETPLGEVQILAVHLHPQITDEGSWLLGHFLTDAARFKEIARYLPALREQLPTLILGDFNEGTDGAALRYLEGRGFRSALPEFQPDATTWRWPFGRLSLTAQLDHVTYDASLEPLAAAVIHAGRSDHYPVRALFIRAATEGARPRAPHGVSMAVDVAP